MCDRHAVGAGARWAVPPGPGRAPWGPAGGGRSDSLDSVSERPLPSFVKWSSFPFEGDFRVKPLAEPVPVEPPRRGEDPADCPKCHTPDDAYIWVNEHWRVRSLDKPGGLPMVLILESRSHLDLGDLPNMLAAELGVMIVRLERAIRSLDGVARVHVNRWGDGAAHLHIWFLARPYGRLQLRGTFLTLWDEILPPVPEAKWRENLALVAAWLAEFGGTPLAEPPRIQWKAPSSFEDLAKLSDSEIATVLDEEARQSEADGSVDAGTDAAAAADPAEAATGGPAPTNGTGPADETGTTDRTGSVPDAGSANGAVDGSADGAAAGGVPQQRAATDGSTETADQAG